MEQTLQEKINSAGMYETVRLKGEIRLGVSESKCFYVGKSFAKSLIEITKPNLILDGSDAVVRLELEEEPGTDLNVFFVSSMAKNVQMNNLNLQIHLNFPGTVRQIVGIYNTAYGLKLNNCRIEIISENQANLTAVCNNGNLDTHMETRADNLVVENCLLSAQVVREGERRSQVVGLKNQLANSISVQNTFVYATNRGTGEFQQAVGIWTNGRFGRFVGNNVKANGSHNVGKLLESAHAYGFVNEGLYNLISSSNLVGEWGGCCIGLENRGDFANVRGNKILATHTVKGRAVRNRASDCVFDGNIITSTSRNPRLIEHEGRGCILSNNLLEGLLGRTDYFSSCGIYAPNEGTSDNLISGNVIKNVGDCGIFASRTVGRVENNIFIPFPDCEDFRDWAEPSSAALSAKLDESRIVSIEG